jgi:2-dehydropantoate 2-reductase
MNMKLTIIGAGAMGSLLGYFLSQVSDVWLLDPWHEHVTQINSHGLRYEWGEHHDLRRINATTDPADIGTSEIALVLVKASMTEWAAEMADNLGCSLTVTLQNGVGNREVLADTLGDDRVGQAVTALGANLAGPGQVRHAGMGNTIFGSSPNRALAEQLMYCFNQAGLPAEVSDDLDALVWGKLIVNVGINALTALLRVPNATLAEVPAATALVAQVVAEAVAVAAARGITLPYADPLAHVLSVARTTATNRSSMLQDVQRGVPTEISTINGAIVREGQRLGIATPVNTLIMQLVQSIDATVALRV